MNAFLLRMILININRQAAEGFFAGYATQGGCPLSVT